MDVQSWMMVGLAVGVSLAAVYLLIGLRYGWFKDD